MSLSDSQWLFLKDVAALINHAATFGYKLTGGELKRTEYQQAEYLRTGKSKTMKSRHLISLAIDFQGIWGPGDPAPASAIDVIKPLGDYWKSLSPKNVWGGDWGWDANHFERIP